MTAIELPDEQAAALKARAAALGLTLEDWFKELAPPDEHPAEAVRQSKQAAAASILELQKSVKPDPEGWTIRDYIEYGRR